jgi:hypothetical protein
VILGHGQGPAATASKHRTRVTGVGHDEGRIPHPRYQSRSSIIYSLRINITVNL